MELKRKNRISAEFSMASMTDIIFLLLIFFMITSSAISSGSIEVSLPSSEVQNKTSQNRVTISLTKEGKYFVNDVEIPKDQVESRIKNELEGKDRPGFIIRADADCRHGDVVFLMSIAELNKYDIAIATVYEK